MAVNPSALGQNKGLSELWRRLRFVFMAIIIYRIGTHIPIPGIDPDKLANIFQQNQGTLLDLFNMFSGGALERNEHHGAQHNAIHYCIHNHESPRRNYTFF